ncbi:auxin-responsive protein SAUR32-like [Rutidosis leptorrhynchoides]|uniref:auxin-responsive protein SAUR32-like n=1 Tax=Rutidosis leptorrhynchoides TaxID=125765 RepID=UPI003A98D955
MGTSTILTTITTTNRCQRKHHQQQEVPKGCLAVKVGERGVEQRFVVPVVWFNHPIFMQLLKEAEDEYGFEQKGTITIPCNVHHFQTIIAHIIQQNHQRHSNHHHSNCYRSISFIFICIHIHRDTDIDTDISRDY